MRLFRSVAGGVAAVTLAALVSGCTEYGTYPGDGYYGTPSSSVYYPSGIYYPNTVRQAWPYSLGSGYYGGYDRYDPSWRSDSWHRQRERAEQRRHQRVERRIRQENAAERRRQQERAAERRQERRAEARARQAQNWPSPYSTGAYLGVPEEPTYARGRQ